MHDSQAVFIHPNPDVLNRITRESNGNAKVTSSLAEATRWISNPQEKISGIFLCPDDGSFSAFRFLDLSIQHRPATPVFLLEESLKDKIEEAKRIQNATFVQGIYSGNESYSTLVSTLKSNTIAPPSKARKKPRADQEVSNFTAAPVSDFFTGESFTSDVYLLSENGSMKLFASKNSPIQAKHINELASNIDFLYLETNTLNDRRQSLKDTYQKLIENKDFPDHWKTAEVLAKTRELLDQIRNSGFAKPLMEVARSLVSDLQLLILNINTEDRSLYQLINRAFTSDRSIYCASLSILICQHLKFEKKSTLEILGIASILQDISLYNTPFGDLSARDPQSFNEGEFKYHQRHPVLSADIIAHNTNVPQVTLQVIRQHHERKDRTGYPNRVGGIQLHPMAEILSLINDCYDFSKKNSQVENVMVFMENEVFPHYSDATVAAFKKIHSRL